MKKAAVILGIAAVVVAAGGLAAWRWHWPPGLFGAVPGYDSAERGASDKPPDLDRRNIRALGRLAPAGGVLAIGAGVGDRIEKLYVEEGERLEAGALIAELASRPLRLLEQQALEAQIRETEARRQAEEAAAKARIQIAQANLDKARSSQTEIDAQKKQVELAASNLELAQEDLKRLGGLSAALVSRQEVDRQELLVRKAEAELAAAQAALKTLQQSRQFALQAAQAELAAAQASKKAALAALPRESLQKKLDLAVKQTEQTRVVAPAAGTVLRIFTRAGEPLANKPILQLADLTQMTCVAEVFEGDLPRVRIGQTALIQGPAIPEGKTIRGRVTRIGAAVGSPELRSLDPFAPTDRHVVEVEIELEPGALPEAARRAHLQVDVRILASQDERADENSPGVAQSRP